MKKAVWRMFATLTLSFALLFSGFEETAWWKKRIARFIRPLAREFVNAETNWE
jgi:hypothetical protein